jgi:hypothetical protein
MSIRHHSAHGTDALDTTASIHTRERLVAQGTPEAELFVYSITVGVAMHAVLFELHQHVLDSQSGSWIPGAVLHM